MAREDPTIYMRIPEALKQQLDRAAAKSHRSLTSEVVARIERTFSADGPPTGLDLSGIPTVDLLAELGRRCER